MTSQVYTPPNLKGGQIVALREQKIINRWKMTGLLHSNPNVFNLFFSSPFVRLIASIGPSTVAGNIKHILEPVTK